MTLHKEIHEQPDCLQRLLHSQKNACEQIARTIREKDVRFIYIAARGTSENAARYANYVWGVRNGLPVALAAPSMFTYYNNPPRLGNALVVGISQSGRSPDIVSVLAEGRRQGCTALAITNAVHSPLAQAADFVLDISAGEEQAVAATKSYSSELLSIAMLSAALNGDAALWKELAHIPDWVQFALSEENVPATQVQRYRSITSCVVLGRGFNYATAHEWALKLKELAYVEAQPFSSADFLHGPIAMVNGGFVILAVVPSGAVYSSMIEVLMELTQERSAKLVMISDQKLGIAETSMMIPSGVPEWLSPIVSIIPAQLFSYHLARARGCDTESPRGIHKVTETR